MAKPPNWLADPTAERRGIPNAILWVAVVAFVVGGLAIASSLSGASGDASSVDKPSVEESSVEESSVEYAMGADIAVRISMTGPPLEPSWCWETLVDAVPPPPPGEEAGRRDMVAGCEDELERRLKE